MPGLSEWSEISRQLQKRRAELAAATSGGSPAAAPAAAGGSPAAAAAETRGAPTAGNATASAADDAAAPSAKAAATVFATGSDAAAAKQQAPSGKKMTRGPGVRGGIRHSAMGAVLRQLRSEGQDAVDKG